MTKKNNYTAPQMQAIEIACNIIAVSTVKYTNNSASKEHEVLSKGQQGDWGDVWK